jgi:hypothetical protein
MHVEEPARLLPQLLAASQDPAHLAARVRKNKFPAREATDLAVLLVRRERRVDPAEPGEDVVERGLVDVVVANVDDDRHPHDLLDATNAGQNVGDGAHARFAFRIADCSDSANAWLVSVAPETRLTFALRAFSVSTPLPL